MLKVFSVLLVLCGLALSHPHRKFHHEETKEDLKALYGDLKASEMKALNIDSATWTKDGRPRMMFGNFGRVAGLNETHVLEFLKSSNVMKLFRLTGEEVLEFRHAHSFKDIVSTYRFDQFLNDLPVFGGEIAVHITPKTLEVHGISGNLIAKNAVPQPSSAVELNDNILKAIESKYQHSGVKITEHPVLQYMIDEEDQGRLCYHMRILSRKSITVTGKALVDAAFLEPFDVYIDAVNHELLMDISVWQKVLYRQVFDAQNGKTLPGVLLRKEGEPPVSDSNANEAYDNAGKCYYYYLNVYGRDSWNNQGSPLNSSVHYQVNYDNAFWNGQQMVYGDGDNIIFSDFTGDLSVICHEISHGVTQSTSNLRYWYESGSLNEAFSDIMGSSAVVYTADPTLDRPDPETSWIIGPNCTLQNLNPTGCPDCPLGIRYMNNPPLDGSSRDYYPDRYTGLEDDRGVHWNSGIANLAYVLTVQGGVHPEQKTTVYVEPIGLTHAQQVYYLGFTQYMTATSVYTDARAATLKASQILYPTNQAYYDSVGNAWTAVGVNPLSTQSTLVNDNFHGKDHMNKHFKKHYKKH